MSDKKYITIALPKGRLQEQIADYLKNVNITIKEESRKLDCYDHVNGYRFLFVKNSDVPVYVNYGVADLGVSGSDVIYEGDFEFLTLLTLPFGSTRICVAGYEKDRDLYFNTVNKSIYSKDLRIATKFTRFSRDFFLSKGVAATLIKLTGSVELAPILGLADYIIDLVETGTTLKENNLTVIDEIGRTEVRIIANRSLYKLNYKKIDDFISKVKSLSKE